MAAGMVLDFLDAFNDFLRHGQDFFAVRAKAQATSFTVKKLDLQLAFKFGQCHADGRLRDEQAIRCRPDRSGGGDGDEFFQLFDADTKHQ
jgi:hypothetical protein